MGTDHVTPATRQHVAYVVVLGQRVHETHFLERGALVVRKRLEVADVEVVVHLVHEEVVAAVQADRDGLGVDGDLIVVRQEQLRLLAQLTPRRLACTLARFGLPSRYVPLLLAITRLTQHQVRLTALNQHATGQTVGDSDRGAFSSDMG